MHAFSISQIIKDKLKVGNEELLNAVKEKPPSFK